MRRAAIGMVCALLCAIGASAQEASRGMEYGHEWVDLGLSVKWATCNLGAAAPEEYGKYYAWGDTAPKIDYTKHTCLTRGMKMGDISASEADAARINWMGKWRMPTIQEWDELVNKCTWTWATRGHINGYEIKGPNGNTIYLPAAGYCYYRDSYSVNNGLCYWSSTPRADSNYDAYCIDIGCNLSYDRKYKHHYGRSIRPIID